MYIQHDYDNNGNLQAVTAYNDYLDEYHQTEVFKTYFNQKMQEYYVLPQYALELF